MVVAEAVSSVMAGVKRCAVVRDEGDEFVFMHYFFLVLCGHLGERGGELRCERTDVFASCACPSVVVRSIDADNKMGRKQNEVCTLYDVS